MTMLTPISATVLLHSTELSPVFLMIHHVCTSGPIQTVRSSRHRRKSRGRRVPQNLDWATLVRIVSQILSCFTILSTKTPFQAKKIYLFPERGICGRGPIHLALSRPLFRYQGYPPLHTPPLAPNQASWIRPCVPRIPARFTLMW